jgi:hypothetical protein
MERTMFFLFSTLFFLVGDKLKRSMLLLLLLSRTEKEGKRKGGDLKNNCYYLYFFSFYWWCSWWCCSCCCSSPSPSFSFLFRLLKGKTFDTPLATPPFTLLAAALTLLLALSLAKIILIPVCPWTREPTSETRRAPTAPPASVESATAAMAGASRAADSAATTPFEEEEEEGGNGREERAEAPTSAASESVAAECPSPKAPAAAVSGQLATVFPGTHLAARACKAPEATRLSPTAALVARQRSRDEVRPREDAAAMGEAQGPASAAEAKTPTKGSFAPEITAIAARKAPRA